MTPYLSIVIPVYNEEEILESSINKNIDVLKKSGFTFEIIIVNDSSTDSSSEILCQKFSENDFVEIIHHSENKGFGGAVKTGIQAIRGDYIWCIPVDSPLTEDTFYAFEKHFGEADILIGYRIERKGYNQWMKLNSKVFHFLVSMLFRMKLKDYNWIHLYRNKIFKEGGIQIQFDGLFMLAEVLIKATKKGYTIKEFPVEQQQRLTGIASASKLINVIRALGDILKFKFLDILNKI